MMMHLLDLFSGIGGFSLGLERSGAFKTVAFCEIEPYCQKVLAKHWPQVPIYDDVRTITADRLASDGIAVDAICGGFPCQDISCAGKGAGLEGERSGLWFEYARIIGELRPRYVIVENVSALLSRGLDRVLGTLASLGYDAEWHCIPASAIGAPHRRDRVWIIGWDALRKSDSEKQKISKQNIKPSGICEAMADPENKGVNWGQRKQANDTSKSGCGRNILDRSIIDEWNENATNPNCGDRSPRLQNREQADRAKTETGLDYRTARYGDLWNVERGTWSVEPDVGRVANGVPARSHRLRALGNAVVPQIPELIGRAIAAREAA